MNAVVQRVTSASVTVEGRVIGRIGHGLCVLVGVACGDGLQDIEYMVNKLVNLRIFTDDSGKFNLSVSDVGGGLLLVSQFTLLADTRKGRRPSFVNAAPPQEAETLFNRLVEKCIQTGIETQCGRFQAYMQVDIANDGPVTIILDSKEK
jgi:D-tyrosyl-tRNA(Tyr) deacylase